MLLRLDEECPEGPRDDENGDEKRELEDERELEDDREDDE